MDKVNNFTKSQAKVLAGSRSSYCGIGRSPLYLLLYYSPFSSPARAQHARTRNTPLFSLPSRAVPAARGARTGLPRHLTLVQGRFLEGSCCPILLLLNEIQVLLRAGNL